MANNQISQTSFFNTMKWIKENKSEIVLKILYTTVFALLIIFIVSCADKSKSQKKVMPSLDTIRGKAIQSNHTKRIQKVKQIKENEILVVIPSKKQLDSLQRIMDEDEYYTFIDNSTFYFNQAKEYCETIHSSIIEINSGEKVVFMAKNGQQFPFTTKDMFWEMIVFNGKTKPELIDITIPQEEMVRVYNNVK